VYFILKCHLVNCCSADCRSVVLKHGDLVVVSQVGGDGHGLSAVALVGGRAGLQEQKTRFILAPRIFGKKHLADRHFEDTMIILIKSLLKMTLLITDFT
jgi:hypothetical protein